MLRTAWPTQLALQDPSKPVWPFCKHSLSKQAVLLSSPVGRADSLLGCSVPEECSSEVEQLVYWCQVRLRAALHASAL